jgi:hypothetical protein
MDDDSEEYTPHSERSGGGSRRGGSTVKKEAGHSAFVGVTWHRQDQKWQAAIKVEGKSIHLVRSTMVQPVPTRCFRAAEVCISDP